MLLDTHVWLWACLGDRRLGARTRATLADPNATLFLSAVSAWETTIKFRLGKLSLPVRPLQLVEDSMRLHSLLALPVTHVHACAVSDLTDHHHDPFDRLLLAQATVENLELVTADEVLRRYQVPLRWALD